MKRLFVVEIETDQDIDADDIHEALLFHKEVGAASMIAVSMVTATATVTVMEAVKDDVEGVA